MELLSSSCAPTESPLKELNIGFAPFVLKSPISLMTETLRLGPLEHVPRCELRDTSIAVKPITVRQPRSAAIQGEYSKTLPGAATKSSLLQAFKSERRFDI